MVWLLHTDVAILLICALVLICRLMIESKGLKWPKMLLHIGSERRITMICKECMLFHIQNKVSLMNTWNSKNSWPNETIEPSVLSKNYLTLPLSLRAVHSFTPTEPLSTIDWLNSWDQNTKSEDIVKLSLLTSTTQSFGRSVAIISNTNKISFSYTRIQGRITVLSQWIAQAIALCSIWTNIPIETCQSEWLILEFCTGINCTEPCLDWLELDVSSKTMPTFSAELIKFRFKFLEF